MSRSYVIQWKSKVNGRAGKGNKLFNQEEAKELAAELNREYPDIQHEPLRLEGAGPPGLAESVGSAGERPGSQADETTPAFASSSAR